MVINDQNSIVEVNSQSQDLSLVTNDLKTVINQVISSLHSAMGPADCISELEDIHEFLETLELIQDTLPEERFIDSIRNSLNSIRDVFDHNPNLLSHLKSDFVNSEFQIPNFIVEIIRKVGPDIHVSSNHMKAWINIRSSEAPFYRIEDIHKKLNANQINYGIKEEKIKALLAEKRFDENVLIAEGHAPTPGTNGRVEYKVNVDDISHKPKLLKDGSASYKEIELFVYVQAGDLIAELIPSVPGKNGYTVYHEAIAPATVHEASLPKLQYTKTQNNKQQLVATENCCVTKQNNQIILSPALKIQGKVSNETGNINSRVSVIVMEDVLTDFSVNSDQTICIQGVVEGATITSKENLILKGGVHGKNKACLQANGDIKAASISHAVANAMGQVVVDSQIINSTVYSVGSISIIKEPGEIIGGELDANGDIVANTIGSEMGIHTVIRMGGRKSGLKTIFNETRNNITEQEKIIDQCNQVLYSLNEQYMQNIISQEEYETIKNQAKEMQTSAKEILESLQNEADGLQLQIESIPNEIHTVRARKTIHPGVVIQINGVELKIEQPTGPATIIKEGDQLKVYPFKEL